MFCICLSLTITYKSILKDTAELFFEDVRLPSSAVLGEPNKGFYYLMQELPQERLIIADMAQASLEWMFEETRAYVKQRKAFGKTISNLPASFLIYYFILLYFYILTVLSLSFGV